MNELGAENVSKAVELEKIPREISQKGRRFVNDAPKAHFGEAFTA
jgi:hypothetical protein